MEGMRKGRKEIREPDKEGKGKEGKGTEKRKSGGGKPHWVSATIFLPSKIRKLNRRKVEGFLFSAPIF